MKRTLLTFILLSSFTLWGVTMRAQGVVGSHNYFQGLVHTIQAGIPVVMVNAAEDFPQGDDEALNAVKFYPSPVKDMLTVHFDKRGNHTVIIYNMLFERVMTKTVEDDNDLKFDMSQMQNGVYFLNYEFEGKTVSKKFIKQN